MTISSNRRTEPRLRYCWEVYLANGNPQPNTIARMVDLSRNGASLLIDRSSRFEPGQHLRLQLSYPQVNGQQFDIHNAWIEARIIRKDSYNCDVKRLALKFSEPLDYCPTEDNSFPLLHPTSDLLEEDSPQPVAATILPEPSSRF